MFVVDASVLVAMLKDGDAHNEVSRDWFLKKANGNAKLIAPVIALAEVAAAIARPTGDEKLATVLLEQLKTSGIEFVDVSRQLAEKAAGIAIAHRLRGCDAVYVALAAEFKMTLVSLDNEHLQRTKSIITAQLPS